MALLIVTDGFGPGASISTVLTFGYGGYFGPAIIVGENIKLGVGWRVRDPITRESPEWGIYTKTSESITSFISSTSPNIPTYVPGFPYTPVYS